MVNIYCFFFSKFSKVRTWNTDSSYLGFFANISKLSDCDCVVATYNEVLVGNTRFTMDVAVR